MNNPTDSAKKKKAAQIWALINESKAITVGKAMEFAGYNTPQRKNRTLQMQVRWQIEKNKQDETLPPQPAVQNAMAQPNLAAANTAVAVESVAKKVKANPSLRLTSRQAFVDSELSDSDKETMCNEV